MGIAAGLETPLSFFQEGQQAEYAIAGPDQANVVLGDGDKMRADMPHAYQNLSGSAQRGKIRRHHWVKGF